MRDSSGPVRRAVRKLSRHTIRQVENFVERS
jgi:hypothetical protein